MQNLNKLRNAIFHCKSIFWSSALHILILTLKTVCCSATTYSSVLKPDICTRIKQMRSVDLNMNPVSASWKKIDPTRVGVVAECQIGYQTSTMANIWICTYDCQWTRRNRRKIESPSDHEMIKNRLFSSQWGLILNNPEFTSLFNHQPDFSPLLAASLTMLSISSNKQNLELFKPVPLTFYCTLQYCIPTAQQSVARLLPKKPHIRLLAGYATSKTLVQLTIGHTQLASKFLLKSFLLKFQSFIKITMIDSPQRSVTGNPNP